VPSMTCSTSSARCSWLRLASALLCLACTQAALAAPVRRLPGGELERAWFRVVGTLESGDVAALREQCEALRRTAQEAGVRRLTPFAVALVAQARGAERPFDEELLRQAALLDPRSPEANLALAPVALARGQVGTGLASLCRGLWFAVTDSRLAPPLVNGALLALTVVSLVGFGLWALAAIRRSLPQLWHDLGEMSASLGLGVNGTVVAVLVLALPVVAAGDPVWLVLWVFALAWAYLGAVDKAAGAAGLLLVIASPLLVNGATRSITHQPDPITRATAVLADGRYDPLALQQLASVADVFEDDPAFLRLQGDLYRQFGLLDEAALVYQEGLRKAPDDAALAIALGVVRYQEGDYNAALQAFQTARDAGGDPVVANFDLSLALAQTYHFKESDEAMTRARSADPRRLRLLTGGNDHEVVAVPFREGDAKALIASKDPVLLLKRGIIPPPAVHRGDLLHPLAVAGVVALFVALLHFLLRDRFTGFASACLKCGRAFCRRCKLSHESQSYCTQCVNIFLKKDMVAIDAQLAKRRQLARRQLLLSAERRVLDLLCPGVGLWWSGRRLAGFAVAVVALAAMAAALLWLPRFCAPVALFAGVWPLQAAAAAAWLGAVVAAQVVEAPRR